jgi:RNA polymerase sigma-70 factor (ECF subfamily)
MDRYADGDREAFGVVYDELAPRMLTFVRAMVGSRSAAEDVVQQAFLQLHEARGSFRRGSRVEPWAYTIARRLAIDWARRGKRRGETALPDDDRVPSGVERTHASPERQVVQKELDAALNEELSNVPAKLREAFVLLRLEGFSTAETAQVLGVTTAAAKVRAHRAGLLLKLKMERFFAEEST